ncbi:MAG: diguanylate cyclase [Candidatus Melainabacteria bacterium]|nr:diguanylate cyclase [Candidatus Melainabacteria bacterium]
MAEPSRIQLQMMLVQQGGPGALPLSILPPQSFLPFLRQVEQLAVEERLRPVLVYWSRQSAARLLPAGSRFRELMRDAYCVSIFSEDRLDPPDEWCFLLESHGLCLVVYGQQALESPDGEKYQCTGSMEPALVKQAFDRLLPKWQQLDLSESNRLEDARANLGPSGSAPPYMQRVRSAWPIVKAPIQQGLILDPLHGVGGPDSFVPTPMPMDTSFGKIQPIAFDSVGGGNGGSIISPPGAGAIIMPMASNTGPAAVIGPSTTFEDSILSLEVPNSMFADISAAPPAVPPVTHIDVDDGDLTLESHKIVIDDSGEPQPLMPPAAQSIISEIIGRLRHQSDLSSILQFAIEMLAINTNADRGLIWRIEGDHLKVTNEFALSGHNCFLQNQLTSHESMAVVFEFLSRFPDETGVGVISIPNTARDTNLHKVSPTLSSLIELGGVQARLMAQLRSRGTFFGFLELQQCTGPREWNPIDAVVLQKVAEVLAVVVQQTADQSKIEMDAQEMKLINEIASLFRESRGMSTKDSLVKSVMLVARHMGFIHSEIYLYNKEESVLEPQTRHSVTDAVDLSDKSNPFVEVFNSGRGKMINIEFTRKPDPFFKHDMALVLPLTSEGSRLGVIGLWHRSQDRPDFRPQDRELGLTISGHLSNVIRADQAILQIRSDQARAALINRVSSEIRNALKRADQIMETLVEALHEFFDLKLCVASLYDNNAEMFRGSKVAGEDNLSGDSHSKLSPLENPDDKPKNLGEHLFSLCKDRLKDGETIFLTKAEIEDQLDDVVAAELNGNSATMVPLFYAGNFKAALCMVSKEQQQIRQLPEKDMHMVLDLADRVAVVISHAELFAKVELESITDPMTGLYNRRHFEGQLSKEIDRYQRFGHPFSFIIIDLDYLKRINDSLGHDYGDDAIKHIGNVLKKSIRDVDTVARFGGEEFVVLLPETDLKWARMVAERICTSIREKYVEGVGTVTASLGVAVFPRDADDKERLFELADKALFLAKHRGRDQVCTVADDLMPSGSEVEFSDDMKEKVDKDRYVPFAGNAPAPAEVPVKADVNLKLDTIPAFDLEMVADKGILGILAQIIKTLEEKDAYGPERSPRVYGYASKMATSLHLSKEHAEVVSLAAVLSNLGKISIPEDILKKPGPLSEAELGVIHQTPTVGAKLLEPAKLLYRVSQIIEACHEHWDGEGYPNGLRGHDIPVEAQIVSLVDCYVAMTSDRPYREALSHEESVRQIQSDSGKRWDARLVKIFLSILQKEQKQA